MQRQLTVGRYRAVDLSLLAVILIVFETILVRAAREWFPAEPYTVSCVAAVTAVVMVRWGPWCAAHAVIGGIVTVLVSRGNAQQFLIYGIGNLAALAVLPLERRWGWEKLRKDILVNFLFAFLVLLAMQAGRTLVALALGALSGDLLIFVTTDSVTYIFTLAILWIVSRLDGMLEDQIHYLNRLSQETER